MAIYWVEAGHGGTDSGTEANPWLTIDQAMAGLGDGDKVWVKATAPYAETVVIDGHQATWSACVIMEGYTTATGDGGQVTITGSEARANCVTTTFAANTNWCWKNFIFTGCTGTGVSLNNIDRMTWKNCSFYHNDGSGILSGMNHHFDQCEFNDNGADGVACQGGAIFIGCNFYRNAFEAIDASGSVVAAFCTFFSTNSNAFSAGAANDGMSVMINCTIDGDARDTAEGFSLNNVIRHGGCIVNSIVYDCILGIVFDNGEMMISRNNLVNNNGADYGDQGDTFSGEVVAAPDFTAEATQDYSLGAASPARGAGFDNSVTEGDTSGIDIGSRQSEAGAGGGGLLMNPGTSGGARG